MMNPSMPFPLTTLPLNMPHAPIPPPLYVVTPVTYQFQVIEFVTDNKIVKVELQVQMTNHDASGNILNSSGFVAIPRIQLPFVEYAK
jgi:hypothetical protein